MDMITKIPVVLVQDDHLAFSGADAASHPWLLRIGFVSLLQHNLALLAEEGFRTAYVQVRENQEKLHSEVRKLKIPGMQIKVVQTREYTSHAKILRHIAAKVPAQSYVVLAGTVRVLSSLRPFLHQHRQGEGVVSMLVRPLYSGARLEQVRALQAHLTSAEKREEHWQHYPAGVYAIDAEVLRSAAFRTVDAALPFCFSAATLRSIELAAVSDELYSTEEFLQANLHWAEEQARENGNSFITSGGEHAPLRIGPVIIHPDAEVSASAILIGPAVIAAGSRVESRSVIMRSVVREGAIIKTGAVVQDAWVARNAVVKPEKKVRDRIVRGVSRTQALSSPFRDYTTSRLHEEETGGQQTAAAPAVQRVLGRFLDTSV